MKKSYVRWKHEDLEFADETRKHAKRGALKLCYEYGTILVINVLSNVLYVTQPGSICIVCGEIQLMIRENKIVMTQPSF